MYEIMMSNGSYFWTPAEPIWLLQGEAPRMVQLGTAANVSSARGFDHLRGVARKQLVNGQIATTFLNPELVSSVVDLD